MKRTQWGFFFDQTRCCGCLTCVLACRQRHKGDSDSLWRWVTAIEEGEYPCVTVSFLSLSCLHCQAPACVACCPTGAVVKQEDHGAVVVDGEQCLGGSECGACYDACPYHVPRFGHRGYGKMEKCDFCLDRIEAGKEPLCVASCPARALDFGPLKELQERHGARRDARGFTWYGEVGPSILFKTGVKGGES